MLGTVWNQVKLIPCKYSLTLETLTQSCRFLFDIFGSQISEENFLLDENLCIKYFQYISISPVIIDKINTLHIPKLWKTEQLGEIMMLQYHALKKKKVIYLFIFVFCLFKDALAANGSSWVRGWIGSVAASPCLSNARSEPRLRPKPQLTATPDP